ncbi:hypothetical protein A5630_23030 [Mycolicibacterium mucogenicum]|uniref:Uncharacterized protein n=1 Tax=Mycolicibacterium mucogenicum TaxID=56689 RepID=A0A1A3H153_MYCMU|nr:hypothetical protein A5630_23030 [Mycolicibacterium mucogenicum]
MAAVGGPSGVLAGIVGTKLFERRKDKSSGAKLDAEAAQIIAETAASLLVPVKAELAELRGRFDALEADNRVKTTRLDAAVRYIRELLAWITIHVPDKRPPSAPDDLGEVT